MPLTIPEIIIKKRSGSALSRAEFEHLIGGYVRGEVPDYQMSALLMAVYFAGMDLEETVALTDVMLRSGTVVDLSRVPGLKVDKHSTGGVGDKVSIILAPMVAACGVPVPMISGRGLGHTGGTLDKLESIPGFRTDLSLEEYVSVIAETGVVMIGQTKDIAPADKRIYALRDVTGTVESIPLICGSIMSKKLAEGIDGLVLDVKTGRGAFMKKKEVAVRLAEMLIAIGTKFGKKTVGLITDMDQPLGYAIGNWLEIVECVGCMKAAEVTDLMEVTYALGSLMLVVGGKAPSIREGIKLCRESVESGKALRKFRELVARQGGDGKFLDHPETYPKSAYRREVISTGAGDVGGIDALELGRVSVLLGAGRTKVDEAIDPKAGILLRKKIGDAVDEGEVLAVLYSDRPEILDESHHRVERAFTIATEPSTQPPLLAGLIDETGLHPWPYS